MFMCYVSSNLILEIFLPVGGEQVGRGDTWCPCGCVYICTSTLVKSAILTSLPAVWVERQGETEPGPVLTVSCLHVVVDSLPTM